MHFSVFSERHKEAYFTGYAILFTPDHRVSHAVTAAVAVQFGFHRFPAGVPHGIPVLDVEISAAVIHGHIVVAVTGNAAQAGIPVKTVAACRIADQAKKLFATKIIDPRIRRTRSVNHILASGIIKAAILHVLLPPKQNGFFLSDSISQPVS